MVIPTDFLIFWVGIGAGITALSSLFVTNLTAQIAIFCISSILLIFCTKPFVKRFTTNSESIKTNTYSLIGKEGLVISDIDPITGKGQIKVDGETWSAKTNNSQKIPKDTIITVTAIEGVKAIVAVKEKIEIKN
jgi:membrane protein implicated in regulation of membrane protease activity